MIDLLATLVIYQHANCLEYNTIYRTEITQTGDCLGASYTPVHSSNILIITHILGFPLDLGDDFILGYTYITITN